MKPAKHSLLIAAFAILAAPSLASAAWWNPASWFKKSANQNPPKVVQVSASTSTPATKVATSTSASKPISVKPKTILPQKLTNAEIIKKVKPAVVYIRTADDGVGSGMIISSDGYVLTNAHVVKGFTSIDISISTGETFSGNVVGRDESIDLAVLKINSINQFPKVDFDDSDKVAQGDEVFTFGYPFGIKGDVSFKDGTVSRRIEKYFETSAEIHPGNSGGPLVNRYGKVIGINSALYGSSTQGVQVGETIKLAIPSKVATGLISKLKQGLSVTTTPIVETKKTYTLPSGAIIDEQGNILNGEEFARIQAQKRQKDDESGRQAQALQAQQNRQQLNQLLSEYQQKEHDINQQIIDIKQQYYQDIEVVENNSSVSSGNKAAREEYLLLQANRKIEQLNIQLDQIKLDYQQRIRAVQ